MRRWHAILATTLLTVLGAIALVYRLFDIGTISLVNSTDRTVHVAVKTTFRTGETKLSWLALAPQTTTQWRQVFFRMRPNFALFGTTDESPQAFGVVNGSYTGEYSGVTPYPRTDSERDMLYVWDEPRGKTEYQSVLVGGLSLHAPMRFRTLRGGDNKFRHDFTFADGMALEAHELTLANVTPFHLRVSVCHPTTTEEWVAEGWQSIAPGGKLNKNEVFRSVGGEFAIYAMTQSYESAIVQWATTLRNMPTEAMVWDDADNPEAIAIHRPASTHVQTISLAAPPPTGDIASFVDVPQISAKRHAYRIALPWDDLAKPIETAAADAVLLHGALTRAVAHQQYWGESVAFVTGLLFDAEDDPLVLGLKVTAAPHLLPGNVKGQVFAGDCITWLGKRPIFGVDDLQAAMHEHGIDRARGASEPVPILLTRIQADSIQQVRAYTTYWFEQPVCEQVFWGRSVTAGDAFVNGVADAIPLGFGEEVGAAARVVGRELGNAARAVWGIFKKNYKPERVEGPSYSELKWVNVQREAMLRQWYPKARFAGEIPPLLVSLPRAMVRAFGGRTASRFAASYAGHFAFEAGEQLISYQFADPIVLQSSQDRARDIKLSLAFAGGGSIPALFGRPANHARKAIP